MLTQLNVKVFADGADLPSLALLAREPWIQGFTTNPTLMRQAGVADYREFAARVLGVVPDRPVSFEVFADDLEQMEKQAREIATWGTNVNVKIPVTNTRGESTAPVVRRLAEAGVVVNVTAVFTLAQVRVIAEHLPPDAPAIVSVFAGRIADTGVDPVPLIQAAVRTLASRPKAELLWASPREILNLRQAADAGCHIITATKEVLAKALLWGKDLDEFSLETVRMFHRDAVAAGYQIRTERPTAVGA